VESTGIMYVAFGPSHLAMGLRSALSLRATGNSDSILFVSETARDRISGVLQSQLEPLLWLHHPVDAERNREVKTESDRYSPFEKTMMVDCDTLFLRDPVPAWSYLDNFDVCIKLNGRGQTNPDKGRIYLDGLGHVSDLPHWNSGLVLYRVGEGSRSLFERWHETFQRLGVPWDQISLVEAIFRSDARVLSLDDRWNSQGRAPIPDAFIHHYTSAISDEILTDVCNVAQSIEGVDVAEIRRFLQNRRDDRAKRRPLSAVRGHSASVGRRQVFRACIRAIHRVRKRDAQ
jgi:hypothetical protein